jgi:hypothetical protein
MNADEHEWVEIRRCIWLEEALVIRSFLGGAGIEAFIPDEYMLGVQPFYGLALGGVRVLVRASDLSQAAELLDARAGNPEAEEDGRL